MATTASALHPVEHPRSLRAHVYRMLSAAVVSGELVPGTLLTVPTLAIQFAVSATPVREAMLELEKRGFVEPVRNKGFRVSKVSEEGLRHIIEVRLLLEPPAMGQLATNFPSAALPQFQALADRIDLGVKSRDLRTYLEADHEFHLLLTSRLGNPVLTEEISNLRSQTRLVGLASMLDSKQLQESAAEHAQLLELLVSGDAAGSEALMRHHVGHALGWWAGKPEQ